MEGGRRVERERWRERYNFLFGRKEERWERGEGGMSSPSESIDSYNPPIFTFNRLFYPLKNLLENYTNG